MSSWSVRLILHQSYRVSDDDAISIVGEDHFAAGSLGEVPGAEVDPLSAAGALVDPLHRFLVLMMDGVGGVGGSVGVGKILGIHFVGWLSVCLC